GRAREHIADVAGIERARIRGYRRREIRYADDLDAIFHDHTVQLGALDVAALFDGEVDDDRPRLHRGDGVGFDELRRGPAGNQRGGDHDVHLLAAFVHHAGLAHHPFRRHRARVAADTLGDLALFVVGVR